MRSGREPSGWLGNRRYELLKKLGEGGFGVVYHAFDHQLDAEVALKTLKAPDAELLYHFKREFRALADLAHPNLVTLYELVADEETGQLFFTMELIDGVDFLQYSQEAGAEGPSQSPDAYEETAMAEFSPSTYRDRGLSARVQGELPTETLSSYILDDFVPSAEVRSAVAKVEVGPGFHLGRLLSALRQLAQGVETLHRMGLLHRDLKPSNVLVTREGRVVILDFGLVADLRRDKANPSMQLAGQSMQIVGTPSFMSPEQAFREPLTEASDWYSVGVMLYQALTGELPFDGSPTEIIMQKQMRQVRPPRERVEGIPEWLDELTVALLRPEPEARPTSAELLEQIGAQTHSASMMRSVNLAGEMPLIGRTTELQALRQAFQKTEPGRSMALFLEGETGIGKSHLARLSIALLQSEAPSLVLDARCYKQESIPYKAMDGLMEQLSHYLNMLPPRELKSLIPEGIEELTQVFRVMRRVRALELDVGEQPIDPAEQRRRAFGALRELLCRISKRRKILLFVDDLQWGDVDSAALLIELLRPPDPPALLFLGCFRSEDLDSSPFLQKFLAQHRFFGESFPLERRVVEGLSIDEAAELAAFLLGEPSMSRCGLLLSLARQAGGNPYLLEELVHYLQQHTPPERLHELLRSSRDPDEEADDDEPAPWLEQVEPRLQNIQLNQVFEERFSQLSAPQQELLCLLAAAGQPTARGLLMGLLQRPIEAAELGSLRHQHLIRLRESIHDEEIDIYHERHREALLELLGQRDPEVQRELHRSLAGALAQQEVPDAKRLAFHLSQTGELSGALGYALQAAQDAEEALAFGQAAQWYRQALELQPGLAQERDIYQGLASALAMQGLSESSADAYLKAAALTRGLEQRQQIPHEEALNLQRQHRLQAATQLIRCGQLDRGFELLPNLLRELGLQWSHSPGKTIWTWLRHKLRLLFQPFPKISELPFAPVEAKALLDEPSLHDQVAGLLRESYAQPASKHKRSEFPTQLSPEQALRLEACRLVSIEVGLIDPLQGMAFQAQHLLQAVRARDPYRLALAYAMEAAYGSFQRSSKNPARQRRTEQLTDQALTIGKQLNHPHIIGFCYLTTGFAAFTSGSWRQAYDRCSHAEAILRQSCSGVTWELSNCHFYRMNALLFMGEFREIQGMLPVVLREAEERGDLYTQTNLRLGVSPRLLLVQDQPQAALETVEMALAPWSKRSFHLQHYIELINRGEIELYQGRPFGLWEFIQGQWSKIRRALLLQIQFNRIEIHHLRGRCALACALRSEGASRERFRKEAMSCARLIEKEVARWASPWALQLRAGDAFLGGEHHLGLQRLTAAEARLENSETHFYTYANMLCRGLWLGDEEGSRLAQTALLWMRGQQIQNPIRITQAMLPGCLPLAEATQAIEAS